MSDWKKSYLDALEVPVWLPLSDSAGEKTQVEAAVPSNSSEPAPDKEPEEKPEEKSSELKLRLLHGELKAQYGFVIDAKTDLKSALVTYQQLQFAWQAWLDEPLSAALLQVNSGLETAEQAGSEPQTLLELNEFNGRLFDCGELGHLLTTSDSSQCISAPTFNFKQADKKAWWQLLQNLH